jgi:hypothetical protein
MIFPLIESEPILQVNDKTRINAVKSFISKDEAAITLVEIEPEASAGFINVTGSPVLSKNWFLDWSYATAGSKVATLRITTDGSPVTFTKTITVLTEADDKLWSADSDLQILEPDILNWVRQGRASFLDYHRTAQKRILEWLDNIKVWNKDGQPFTKSDITLAIAEEDLKRISIYWTLEIIFNGLSNKPDDVFASKEMNYRKSRKELQADRSRIRVDYNLDGTIENGEQFQMRTIRLSR